MQAKVLRFPEDVSLGTAIVNYPESSPHHTFTNERRYPAQGQVHVPAGQIVTLELSFEAVAQYMGKCKSLQPDDLYSIQFPLVKVFAEHTEPLTQLTGLRRITSLGIPQDSALEPLAKLPALVELSLSMSAGITDEGLKYLARMPVLETLSLAYTAITDAGLSHLSDLSTLKQLDLSNTTITDRGLMHLKGLLNLEVTAANTSTSHIFHEPCQLDSVLPEEPIREELCASHREFSFRLFNALMKEQIGLNNLIVSPLSVFMALQVVAEGTSSKNFDELMSLLNLTFGKGNELRESSRALKRSIERISPAISILLANSLWFRPEVDADLSYQNCCREYYEADVLPLQSKEQVDQWCSKRTRGLIPSLPITTIKEALILNAVYFQGLWQDEFESSDTIERDFIAAPGNVIRCPFMSKNQYFNYTEVDGLQLIELPYKGRRLSYYALKLRFKNVRKYAQALSSKEWSSLIGSMGKHEGFLAMPRFSYSNRLELDKTLQSLGFGLLYSRPPGIIDKLKLNGEALAVEEILQQALIEVNEKGTTAAALTVVSMRGGSSSEIPSKPFEMILDTPFLYLIVDNFLNIPLFMGILANPQERNGSK